MCTKLTAVAMLLAVLPGTAYSAPGPRLVILTPTGQTRDGLPVLTRHSGAAAIGATLARGFSGRLLRLYAMEQEWLRQKTGRVPEPAYLLLSDRQGGFPMVGFYLDDQRKAEAGWVDLHRGSRPSGRFGAMDQIFPHELLHVIVRQLAGEPRESGGNQVHAIGVRTDPVNAFAEGFAEHVQIMAADDADAMRDTRELRGDSDAYRRADDETSWYARDLARRWWPVRPSQMSFLLWFSQNEQVLRYHAAKANAFARSAVVPADLIARDDKYEAYLFQSVIPGQRNDPPKSAGVMLSTEGVVSHLCWRLATDAAIQQRYHQGGFYTQFGVTTSDVSPLDNVYLKLFAALAEGRPSTTAELLRAYIRVFPDDAQDVARVAREALLGQELPDAPEIWLANEALTTGTSLFDQFRGLARPHTFDINAATALDWLSVPGVSTDLATRLLAGAPYRDLQSLLNTPQLPEPVSARVSEMSRSMERLRAHAGQQEDTLSLRAIARPYLWRLGAVLLVATATGAWVARCAGVRRRWTASLIALAATVVVITLAWFVKSPPWYPIALPVVLGGVPWALWKLVRQHSLRPAARSLLIWALASWPAVVLSGAWSRL